MKKIIAFTISAVAVVALSGCAKTESTNETTIINETMVENTTDVDNASMSEDGNVSNTSAGNGSNDIK